MNREETSKVLTILKLNYPQSFRSYTDEETYMLLDMWSEAFKAEDASIVTQAVKSIIYSDTREFAPNIAQVKAKIYDMSHHDEINELDAWKMAYKAIRHNGEQAKKEFEKLPTIVQKAIGDYSQLINWAMADISQISYIQQSFIKNFNKTKEADKYSYVNQLIGTAERKMIE